MAQLIIGVMHSNEELLKEVKEKLEKKFGELKAEIGYDFNFTNYYEEEMGKNLKKNLLAFKKEIKEKQLAEIKEYTNKLEEDCRIEGKRTVNIDPGYLTKKELVLASNKKSPYKIEISENIYSHLTLKFEDNKCTTTQRTYPDFKIKEVQDFLIRTNSKSL